MKGCGNMGEIISLATYKKGRGIASPRSPYYTLNATETEVSAALNRAAQLLTEPMDFSGKTPYCVLVGYEDKNGRIKLLKQVCRYPSREVFELDAGRKSLMPLALAVKN